MHRIERERTRDLRVLPTILSIFHFLLFLNIKKEQNRNKNQNVSFFIVDKIIFKTK